MLCYPTPTSNLPHLKEDENLIINIFPNIEQTNQSLGQTSEAHALNIIH
jgi:hypothetical protein